MTCAAVVLLSATLALAAGVHAHLQPPHVAGITIVPSDNRESEGHRVTTALSSGGSATCTFKFRTATLDEVNREQAAASPKPVAAASSAPIDFDSVYARLKGSCATKKVEYWEYEVCFGGAVRQVHNPDVYVLGNTGAVDGTTIKYRDGLACDALPGKPPRSVDVTFACDKQSGGATVLRVSEVATCQYQMLVATALVCSPNDKRFEDLTGQAHQIQSAPAASNADPSAEDWYIELKELADGRVVCSTYSLEMRSLGSKLHFRTFDLSVQRSGGSAPATAAAAAAAAAGERPYTARHPGRIDCADDEVTHTAGSGSTALRNTAQFNGKLAFLKAYA